jgi:hypothetical protein
MTPKGTPIFSTLVEGLEGTLARDFTLGGHNSPAPVRLTGQGMDLLEAAFSTTAVFRGHRWHYHKAMHHKTGQRRSRSRPMHLLGGWTTVQLNLFSNAA